MNRKSINCLFITFFILLWAGTMFLAVADDDHYYEHREREHEHHRENHHSESHSKAIMNPVYKEQCGDCHFAYQPEWLPSASWMKILDNLDDHFGEVVELDDDSKRIISDYLASNGADKSYTERAVKVMRGLGNKIPLRITDTPYMKRKHHEISSNILNRKSIGSLSNCSACHIDADSGIYDDDHVRIPK